MRITFVKTFDDFNKEYFKKLENGPYYDIQIRWSKIKTALRYYKKLYLKQAGAEDCDWGVCINNMNNDIYTPVPEEQFDCSAGMVRKLRNNYPYGDDGKCKTCPYFVSNAEINKIYHISTEERIHMKMD